MSRPTMSRGLLGLCVAFAVVLLCPRISHALKAYPIKGVFIQRGASDASSGEALVHPLFLEAVGVKDADLLPRKMRARLPDLPSSFENKDRRTTLVASLMVARASVYRVEKLGGQVTTLYTAVTAAVHLTNMLTGDVAYSKARTTIVARDVSPVTEDDIRSGFVKALDSAVDDLVADVERECQMKEISATIRRVEPDFVLLDRGFKAGLGAGDTLTDPEGSALTVIHCDEGACAGQMVLGTPSEGQVLSKLAPGNVGGQARPGMMVLVQSVPGSFPELTANQVFSDSFGAKAPVTLVPVNPVYQDVLNEVSAQTNATQDGLRKRKLPRWFVILNIGTPLSYELRTANTRRRRITEASATGHIVDFQGRIIASATMVERLSDDIMDGFEVTLRDRQEIAIKNALVGVATNLAQRVAPDRVKLPVSRDMHVADPAGVLANGAGVRVFRKLEGGDGLPAEVLVPVSAGSVAWVDGQTVFQPGLDVVPSLGAARGGDVIIAERIAGGSPGRLRIRVDGPVVDKGDVPMAGVESVLASLIASGTSIPFYTGVVPGLVKDLLSSGNAFETDARIEPPATDASLQITVRLLAGARACEDSVCQDSLKCALQLAVTGDGGSPNAKAGLEVALTTSGFPESTSNEQSMRLRFFEGFKAVRELAPKVVGKLAANVGAK
jgi:hypothetical protein